MVSKLSAIVALASALSASAFNLHAPTGGWIAGGVETVSWTASSSDPPVFQLVLVKDDSLWLIASNLTTTTIGTIEFTVPDVAPGSFYVLEATDVSNVDAVLSKSGYFNIGG